MDEVEFNVAAAPIQLEFALAFAERVTLVFVDDRSIGWQETVADGLQKFEALREALTKLPERERLSLQAFYLQGLDAEQARTVLGLSKSTFYRVLAKARERLAAIHRRMEVGS